LAGGAEQAIGEIRTAGPRGRLAEPLPAGPATLWDERSSLMVVLDDPVRGFESRTVDMVLAGANLLAVGSELLQFRRAELEAPGRMRLSGLLRGRLGTEARVRLHTAGTPVWAVEPELVLGVPASSDLVGRLLRFTALGPGDVAGGVVAERLFEGWALAPLAPVHVRGRREADGTIALGWVARGRGAFEWGGSEPEPGAYSCRFEAGGQVIAVETVSGTSLALPSARQALLAGGAFPPCTVTVEAIGDGPAALRTAAAVAV
jgi:hypothetical protein